MQFLTSPCMQQNSNFQQNIFNTFDFIPQTTTQPPLTQPTQVGGSQKGRGKEKKKWKVIAKSKEKAPLWWTLEEEYALVVAWCRTSKKIQL